MPTERGSKVCAMHVYDDAKDYLPPKWRKDAIKSYCEAKLTGSLVASRYSTSMVPKGTGGMHTAGALLADEANRNGTDFVVVGYVGRKGKKKTEVIASNTLYCMQNCVGSVVIIQQETG